MPDSVQAPTASFRALVVDDEPSLVRVVVGYLHADGFTVDSAADGPTALDIVRQADPDVVVLDLGLPGLNASRFAARRACVRRLWSTPSPRTGSGMPPTT